MTLGYQNENLNWEQHLELLKESCGNLMRHINSGLLASLTGAGTDVIYRISNRSKADFLTLSQFVNDYNSVKRHIQYLEIMFSGEVTKLQEEEVHSTILHIDQLVTQSLGEAESCLDLLNTRSKALANDLQTDWRKAPVDDFFSMRIYFGLVQAAYFGQLYRFMIELQSIQNNLEHIDELLYGLFPTAAVISVPTREFPDHPLDRNKLRDWWHQILRDHGRFSCYAVLLMLPADREAIRYMTEFGKELDQVSGKNCLVTALGRTEVRRSGYDKALWSMAVQDQISGGYSIRVGQLFDIDFSSFPCMVIFQDIRSPAHIAITLKGLSAEEIAAEMRLLFSIINRAISTKEEPLAALESYRKKQVFNRAGKAIVSELRSFTGRTFEAAMEAWMRAVIK